MKKSTSFHTLNADRGTNKLQKVMYFLVNLINNHFLPHSVEKDVVIKDFVTEIYDFEWKLSSIKASPSRKLSELFLMKLPWGLIKTELGQINVLDTGCGSGEYGIKLSSFSKSNIDNYVGIDINEDPNWNRLQALRPNFKFYQLDSASILNHIPKETNFFLTISALEHFDADLLYFKQIRDFILTTSNNTFQLHFFPSSPCLWLYPFHGVRQYTPRTISTITKIFNEFSYSLLFKLGGQKCNSLHYKFITKPLLFKKNDIRDVSPQQYDELLFFAIREDMKKPSKLPSFYALLIHSNYNRKIF